MSDIWNYLQMFQDISNFAQHQLLVGKLKNKKKNKRWRRAAATVGCLHLTAWQHTAHAVVAYPASCQAPCWEWPRTRADMLDFTRTHDLISENPQKVSHQPFKTQISIAPSLLQKFELEAWRHRFVRLHPFFATASTHRPRLRPMIHRGESACQPAAKPAGTGIARPNV